MLNGNQRGFAITSGGKFGVAVQGHSPSSASQYFVKTRVRGNPPCSRIQRRALTSGGESGSAPTQRNAA